MFERYTEQARRVIFFARHNASQYGSPYIETEHLLIGIFREAPELREIIPEVSPEDVAAAAASRATGMKIPLNADIPLSNAGKRTLAYAAEEAENLADKHIGTEHLLFGLLREQAGLAADLFQKAGANLKDVRAKWLELKGKKPAADLYCPKCACNIFNPLTCGDCSAVICRVCGTPLEAANDLGMG